MSTNDGGRLGILKVNEHYNVVLRKHQNKQMRDLSRGVGNQKGVNAKCAAIVEILSKSLHSFGRGRKSGGHLVKIWYQLWRT